MSTLAVDTSQPERNQAIMLLQRAEAEGWLTYDGMQLRTKRGGPDLFRATLPSGQEWELQGWEVKPWLSGLAAAHGVPERVAYREGMFTRRG